MAPQRRRRERGSISVDEIINGAFEVATEVSIDNLSMPQLARHLDVGVTSIYWYFRKKDELLDAVWPETAVSDAVIRVAIGALRKVLDDTAQTPRFIATVPRRGYRFLAPVIVIDPPETGRAGAPHIESCQACGQAVPMPATFCPRCGQRLRGLPAAEPQPHLEAALLSARPAPLPGSAASATAS